MLDPARKKNYEKSTIGISSKSVRVWWDIADRGVCDTADGGDSSQRADCVWRNTDIQRKLGGDRLQVSV